MSFGKTTPILRIFDEAKALEFLRRIPGFQDRLATSLLKQNFPLYLQVSRGECVLHLSEHHGDSIAGFGSADRETDELEAFQQQLLAKEYQFAHPQIQVMPWGSQDMTISDPFANRLVFTNAISV